VNEVEVVMQGVEVDVHGPLALGLLCGADFLSLITGQHVQILPV
jgi:hypothetical protein